MVALLAYAAIVAAGLGVWAPQLLGWFVVVMALFVLLVIAALAFGDLDEDEAP